MLWARSSVAESLISPLLKKNRKVGTSVDARTREHLQNGQQTHLPDKNPNMIVSAKAHMDSVRLKPPSRPSPMFMLIAKFVYESFLSMLIQTNLQETNPIGNKAKDMVLCVDALEKHFDSRPSDVAQQRHRGEVIRYATICPTVLDAETFPVCSRASRHSYSLVAYKTMEIYSNFSKIYERLYLIIRSV